MPLRRTLLALLIALASAGVPSIAQAQTVVVEIGGVGTDTSPGGPWTRLEPYLTDGTSFRRYQYDTCADITTNVHQLNAYLHTLQTPGAEVVLAGHSLGGVLALSAIGNFDLTEQVRGVVVVDAPVNGLSEELIEFGQSLGVVPAPCLALDELEDPAWSGTSAAAAERAMSQGMGLLDVSNAYDNMVPLGAQELPQPVNLRFNLTNGSGLFNHTAVFSSSAALTAIAHFIGTL